MESYFVILKSPLLLFRAHRAVLLPSRKHFIRALRILQGTNSFALLPKLEHSYWKLPKALLHRKLTLNTDRVKISTLGKWLFPGNFVKNHQLRLCAGASLRYLKGFPLQLTNSKPYTHFKTFQYLHKELWTICIFPSVGHWKKKFFVVLYSKTFI